MTPFRTPFKAWLDMLQEINWEYELANPPMTIKETEESYEKTRNRNESE